MRDVLHHLATLVAEVLPPICAWLAELVQRVIA